MNHRDRAQALVQVAKMEVLVKRGGWAADFVDAAMLEVTAVRLALASAVASSVAILEVLTAGAVLLVASAEAV
jgi:hypothetical protein